MASKKRRLWIAGGATLGVAVVAAASLYAAFSYRPTFYRQVQPSGRERQENAERFVERTLQLRNDAANEDRWEAVFTEEQINAWLAEELPRNFSDLLPKEIEEPRIIFEAGRLTLAFTYLSGPIPSVVWAVLRVHSSEENEITLRIEQIRMGLLPVPESLLVERFQTIRGESSFTLNWSREDDETVARLRYTPRNGRGRYVAVDDVQVAPGWIRIAGRTERVEAARRAAGPERSGEQRPY